ncbi:STAS domain protein [Teladorsagia circumcincta]|uniref:STAS domain protein n=1 Tax=Teladorsagia circumcincta TaxID=45464 RepID=A0A2G9UPE7_TELCI|nr:STAS domain protein [Teladorsagia circumcincta]
MGRIPGTSDFKGLGHYRSAEEIPGIKVFRFDAPLYFANAELFILSVHNACGLNPVLVRSKLNERAAAESKSNQEQPVDASKAASDMQLRVVGRRVADASNDSVMEDPTEHVVTQLTHIIIDCSSIPYVDLMGKDALAQTYADYSTIDITVLMANCKGDRLWN